jgi:hypothetical protein
MSETARTNLSGVPETMLITLYLRAMETLRPDALIKDEKAVELVTRLGYDFERVRRIPMNDTNRLVIILRNREMDRHDGAAASACCTSGHRLSGLSRARPVWAGSAIWMPFSGRSASTTSSSWTQQGEGSPKPLLMVSVSVAGD